MSTSFADELHGWLPSLCMITSRAAGAKRFIGGRERGSRVVDLEPRVQVPWPTKCVCMCVCVCGRRLGLLSALVVWRGPVKTGVEYRKCDMGVSHNEDWGFDSAASWDSCPADNLSEPPVQTRGP